METYELRRRHKINFLLGVIAWCCGGWLFVIEHLVFLGVLVTAVGAIGTSINSRLAFARD